MIYFMGSAIFIFLAGSFVNDILNTIEIDQTAVEDAKNQKGRPMSWSWQLRHYLGDSKKLWLLPIYSRTSSKTYLEGAYSVDQRVHGSICFFGG